LLTSAKENGSSQSTGTVVACVDGTMFPLKWEKKVFSMSGCPLHC
jgi:hypothetical protein